MRGFKVLIATAVLLLLIVSPAGARTYEVVSGYEAPPEEGVRPFAPVEVELWELPVWLILVHLACLPAEFFVPLKVWGYLGYRRVRRENLLDNAVRAQIFSCIRDHPGIHLRGLVRETGIKLGTLRYHLNVLQKSHLIVLVESDGHACFFGNDGTYPGSEQQLLVHLRRRVPRGILHLLLHRPSATRKELAESLGVAGSTITWYMARLERDHLIFAERDGRCTRYHVPRDVVPEIEKWLSDPGPAPPEEHALDTAFTPTF
jgi:predicted transcriptional regulator